MELDKREKETLARSEYPLQNRFGELQENMESFPGGDPLVGHILIADDDEPFLNLLVRRAERMGLSIVTAMDGKQAIDALHRNAFDAIIVDLYMPGFTGLEVIQEAQSKDPELQAIILTASATLETALEALRAGVYDYLLKPLDSLSTFELSLTRALERRYLIRENKRLFAEVERLAVTDPLTGLYNRRKLDEALDTEVERARRYKRPMSVLMLDLDGLKSINDSFGHPVGDEALVMVAQGIRDHTRKVDLATRYGGDEFIVLLPEVDQHEALRIAARIRSHILTTELHGHSLSVSAGVAELNRNHKLPKDLLRDADKALYKAKHSNKESIAVYDSMG